MNWKVKIWIPYRIGEVRNTSTRLQSCIETSSCRAPWSVAVLATGCEAEFGLENPLAGQHHGYQHLTTEFSNLKRRE